MFLLLTGSQLYTFEKREVLGRIAYSLMQYGLHRKQCTQQFYCCVCIHYHVNVFTKLLPSNDRGTHTDTGWWEAFMKYTIQTDSGAMMYEYIPSFMKTGPGVQKLTARIHRQHGDLTRLLLCFQNKASRLKRMGRNSNHDTNKLSTASSFIQGKITYSVLCMLVPSLEVLSMWLTITSAMISF
jgi:hypothetical protein